MSVRVEVAGLSSGPRKVRNAVRDLAKAILDSERASGAVTVAFIDEEAMKDINGRYRGSDTATDVLSFRQADSEVEWPEPNRVKSIDLGEVVVCPTVVERYALAEEGDPDTQLGWTVMHGVLHLLGYDHESDDGEMRAREQALLKELDRQVRTVSQAAKGRSS